MIIATRMLITVLFTASLFCFCTQCLGIYLLLHTIILLHPVLHGTMAPLIGPICERIQKGNEQNMQASTHPERWT